MVGKRGDEGSCSKQLITEDGSDASVIAGNEISSQTLPKAETNEFKAKHQILSAEDIRHFMQPYLPPSDCFSSTSSTDQYTNDLNNDRFLRDKTIFYMSQLSDLQKNSKIIEPKCCCLKISTVSIASASVTGTLLIIFIAYVIAKHITSYMHGNEIDLRLTGTVIAISALVFIFIGLFICGILRRRKRWLFPLILSMICLCVALFGTLIAVMITVADNANEEFAKHPNEFFINIVNVFFFRILLLLLLTVGIFVTVCYIRCYRYVSLLHSETKHFVFPSAR